MRTKKEIMEDVKASYTFVSTLEYVTEVLIDIRDILQNIGDRD